MEQIKLEVGKTYEIRGPHSYVAPREMKVVEILKVLDEPMMKLICLGSNNRWYTINGRYNTNRESALDLVREVTPQNKQ